MTPATFAKIKVVGPKLKRWIRGHGCPDHFHGEWFLSNASDTYWPYMQAGRTLGCIWPCTRNVVVEETFEGNNPPSRQ